MTRQTSIQLDTDTEAMIAFLKDRGFGTTTNIMRTSIKRMAEQEGMDTMTDTRIVRANEIDPKRPGGWIADMSPAGSVNPDCWFRFNTQARAERFVALVDNGTSTREAVHILSNS